MYVCNNNCFLKRPWNRKRMRRDTWEDLEEEKGIILKMQKKRISKHQQFHNVQFLLQLLLLLSLNQIRIETALHLLNLVQHCSISVRIILEEESTKLDFHIRSLQMIFRWMKSEGPNLHFRRRYICSFYMLANRLKISTSSTALFPQWLSFSGWIDRSINRACTSVSHKRTVTKQLQIKLKNDITETELIENRAAL